MQGGKHSLFTAEIQLVGEAKVNDRKVCIYPSGVEDCV